MASIQKRPNGKYLVRWRNEENREQSKQFDLMRDAKVYAAKIETDIARGDYVDPKAGNVTLRDFFDEWKQRQVWEQTTLDSVEYTVAALSFADVPLNKIKRSHIESWIKASQKHHSAGTIRTRFGHIRTILRGAISDGVLAREPTKGVRLPRVERQSSTMLIPTAGEVGLLLESAEYWFSPFIALCAFAGLRRGEACAIQLTDVDFLSRTIRVDRQIPENDTLVIRSPKQGSNRVVPAPDDLLVMLSEHVKNVGTVGDEQWLFPNGRGGPLLPKQADYRWKKTREAAALPVAKLHDLRHFYASGLIAAGCDVVTVQRAMGHSSASMTLNTYSHLWPDAADRTRDAAGGLFKEVSKAREDQVRTELDGTSS